MSDLDELFSRDPLKLSDQDLDLIIVKVRSQLAQFNLDGKSQRPAKAKVKKSLDEPKKAKPSQIDLSEIGLE